MLLARALHCLTLASPHSRIVIVPLEQAGIGGPAADPGAIGGPVGSPSGAPPSDGSDGSRSGARTAERSRVHSVFGAGEVAPSTVLYRAGDKVRPTVKDLLNKKSSFYKEASPHKKPRPGLGPVSADHTAPLAVRALRRTLSRCMSWVPAGADTP